MGLWSVYYEWSELGFELRLMNGIRTTAKVRYDNDLGESSEAMRMQAREKAVEMALERRVPLDCVLESQERYEGHH